MVCSFSTVLMVIVMNLCMLIPAGPIQPGIPTVRSLFVMIVVFILPPRLYFANASSAPSGRPPAPASKPFHLCFVLCLLAYFWTLFIVMCVFDPERQVSTSCHQAFGPCGVTDIDLMGNVRKKYNY